MLSNLKFTCNTENQRQKREMSSSYLQQGGRTVLLAPRSQSLHLRVLKQWGRGSLQSWASSPPPAWGSYPWGSEGSSGAQRSAERAGSSRSWLQPFSAGAGAAGLRLRLAAGEECREARCTLSEDCRAGGGNHSAQLRERCTLLLMLRKMPFSAPWCLFSSCPVFLSELSKDPLVFSKRIKSVLYTHSLWFIKINQQINLDIFLNLYIK